MSKPKYGYFVAPERSIYVEDGYNRPTYAVYAWQELPSYTCSPVNPVRCFIRGGFATEEEAQVIADEREKEVPA